MDGPRLRHWQRRLRHLLADSALPAPTPDRPAWQLGAAPAPAQPGWLLNDTRPPPPPPPRPHKAVARRRDNSSEGAVVFRELWAPEGWRGRGVSGRRRRPSRRQRRPPGGGGRNHNHRRRDKVTGRPQAGSGGGRRRPRPGAPTPSSTSTVFVVRVTRGLRGYNSRLFGRWSRWSDCSDSCTTHRTRWCKRPPMCGADIVREEAYCYVENSICQRWVQRHIWRQPPDTESSQESEENALDSGSSLEGGADDVWQCGLPAGNKGGPAWSLTRIVGGRPASKGRWPWQVAILNRYKEVFCGGTLVAPRWVLTAAHCLRRRMYVRLGEHDISQHEGTEIELKVEAAIPHPSYDDETVDSDLALLRLPFTIRPSRYQGLACLPEQGQILPAVGSKCTVIGWGKAQAHDPFGTDLLHEVQVPIARLELCRRVYREYRITDNMFCAGYLNGRRDSCAGDSGGPLLCRSRGRWTIFGITSFGEGCGKKRRFGIYTRLPNYVDWIRDVIGNGH